MNLLDLCLFDLAGAREDVRLTWKEDNDDYFTSVALPGYKRKDIQATKKGNILTISANSEKRGQIECEVVIPDCCGDEVSMKLENGLLEIRARIKESEKKRNIKIE